MTPVKTFSIFGAALMLSSCAHLNFENTLQPMMGQHIQTAFDVLGYPDGVQRWGSDEVFIWTRSGSGIAVIPQVATTTQSWGATPFTINQGITRPITYGSFGPQTMYGTTTYNQFVPTQSSFVLKLIANAKTKRIRSYEFSGNLVPARDLMLRMRSYYLTVMRQEKARQAAARASVTSRPSGTTPAAVD